MTGPLVDADVLRKEVQGKYRAVALEPGAEYHFHTGRPLARKLGYPSAVVDAFPDDAVEAFAGVGNPFELRDLEGGECVVDVGSGAGFDAFVAGAAVGGEGRVVGVDLTREMLARARATGVRLGAGNVEFREGLAEQLPVEDDWADVVIANGVINLCADKRAVLDEIRRVLRAGGWLQFADIANGQPVPESALRDIDLWTGCIAGGLPWAGWMKMLGDAGLVNIRVGEPVDTFGGAPGEDEARRFAVFGYAFLATNPIGD